MRPVIKALLELMVREKHIYTALLSLAEEKKNVLIRNDTDRLRVMLNQEEQATRDIRSIGEEKASILALVSQELSVPANPSLSQIIQASDDPEEKQALADFQQEIWDVINPLRVANDINQQLIETHLQYASFSLELLTQNEPAGNLYGQDGDDGGDGRRGLLDTEA